MARVAEVGRAETEENGDRAAVAALVLEKVHSVFWAHLRVREMLNRDFGRVNL